MKILERSVSRFEMLFLCAWNEHHSSINMNRKMILDYYVTLNPNISYDSELQRMFHVFLLPSHLYQFHILCSILCIPFPTARIHYFKSHNTTFCLALIMRKEIGYCHHRFNYLKWCSLSIYRQSSSKAKFDITLIHLKRHSHFQVTVLITTLRYLEAWFRVNGKIWLFVFCF